LGAAVLEAYRNLLMTGQYPSAVVRLTCAADQVDVNVHPAKSQIKFQDSQLAFRVTNRAIRQVLESAPWLKAEEKALQRTVTSESPYIGGSEPRNLSFQAREFERTQYSTKVFPLAQVRESLREYKPEPETRPAAHRWADLHVIGQAGRTYIVAQSQDSLYLVDQHAAHERVVFERLMETFRAGQIEMQNLLIPLVLDFPASEIEALLKRRDSVEKFGIQIERLGPESLAVQAIPSLVKENAIGEALRRLAFDLSENLGDGAWEKAVGEVFATMACHSVIRAGQTLSGEEMSSLLAQMDQYPLSSFCPHGRPVYVKRPFTEIEREFGRIV
jgi:DNA mismatch repair protein MutL